MCAVFLGSSTAEPSAVNRVVVGSNPTRGASIFQGRLIAALLIGAYSAAGAHFLHTEGATGSNPVTPTMKRKGQGHFASGLMCVSDIYDTISD